jgi:hypothetical protein
VEILLHIVQAVGVTFADMAPYLLFGFLAAGLLSVLVPPERVEKHLGGRGIGPIFKASLFGVPLPLCSCSVIPVAASLRKHGASKPATVAFLTSTPQTGVDSILATYSLLGPLFAAVRPVAALVSGVVAGLAVRFFGPRGTGDDAPPPPCEDECCAESAFGGASRLRRVFRYGFVILPRDLAWPLLAGLAAAGVIAALVPPHLLPAWLGNRFLAMMVMMLLGIPIYVCATASVPIAAALIAKGISPGAALVFLMTGPATNAATISTLLKIVGWRNTVLYLLSIAACALAAGSALDTLGPIAGAAGPAPHAHEGTTLPEAVCAFLLLGVLAPALLPRRRRGAGQTGIDTAGADRQ